MLSGFNVALEIVAMSVVEADAQGMLEINCTWTRGY